MQSIFEILSKYSSLFSNAVITTLLLSIFTVIFASIFGSLVALMKISKVKLFRVISNVYVEFIRGTPLLVQVYVVFYGLPAIGVIFPSFMFMGSDFSRLLPGVIAMVINSTAYICEIVRGGILAVDKGQHEASRSIGFNKIQTMWYVIFPQAVKNFLPSLANEFVSIIKNSSQVSVIGVAELMYITNTVRGISYKTIEPLIIVSVIYFLMTFIVSTLVKRLEIKLAVSDAR